MPAYTGVRKKGKRWYFRINHQRVDGTRYQEERRGYATAAEAWQAKQKYESNIKKLNEHSDTLTVDDFVTQYMEHCKGHVDQSTIRQYKWLSECVKDLIGSKKLVTFRTKDVEQFCLAFRKSPQRKHPEKTNSARSTVHALNFMSGMFEYAIDMELVLKNPVSRYKVPAPPRVPPRYWEDDEINAFLDASLKSRYYIAYSIMAGTGCRIGEACSLRWQYVDLKNGMISIVASFTHAEKGYEEKDPKTDDSIRLITLPQPTLEDLKEHKLRQDIERKVAGPMWEENDLVFATSVGKHVMPHNVRSHMNRVRSRLGLRPLSPHGLRHTHATLLLADGEPLVAVAERLGHGDPAVTARTYAHVLASTERSLAQTMGRHLHSRNG